MDTTKEPPHGSDVFNAHWNCDCAKCKPRRNAVQRLVDSFSAMPAHWLGILSEHPDTNGERLPLPMWGMVYLPMDSAGIGQITDLLRDIEPANEEDEDFAAAGWKEVGQTGIYGIEFDGFLVLGIHGAGYDFYTEHWSKLYDALGYRWHE